MEVFCPFVKHPSSLCHPSCLYAILSSWYGFPNICGHKSPPTVVCPHCCWLLDPFPYRPLLLIHLSAMRRISSVREILWAVVCPVSGIGPDSRVLVRKSRKSASSYFAVYNVREHHTHQFSSPTSLEESQAISRPDLLLLHDSAVGSLHDVSETHGISWHRIPLLWHGIWRNFSLVLVSFTKEPWNTSVHVCALLRFSHSRRSSLCHSWCERPQP